MTPRSAFSLRLAACAAAIAWFAVPGPRADNRGTIALEFLGRHETGVFDDGASEIAAHDPVTQRLYVVNAATATVDVLDIHDPATPAFAFSIDVAPHGRQANSVAVRGGVVAVAVEADVKTDPGRVVFFSPDGIFLSSVTVGALPDMLTFTPNGRFVIVANEGEPAPDYSVDPEGSVSIVDVTGGAANLAQDDVRTARFTAIDPVSLDPSVRIFGPGVAGGATTVAQNLEPEYIAVSHDSRTAWVTLQEANAVAELDLVSGTFTRIRGLGFVDHRLPGNELDPSDRDGANGAGRIAIGNWPVFGMYQPDAVATYRSGGQTYLVMANEGDSREYAAYDETARVSALSLDPAAFPNAATLKSNARLGRLTVTRANGDTDGDGDYDALYAFGGRSFSIRHPDGTLVFDSGSRLERLIAEVLPQHFNANNDANGSFDTRSDNKGPEPEGLAVALLFGRQYAFVGLERIGGVAAYDITDPQDVRLATYANARDFDGVPAGGTAGDLGPEGLLVITAEHSPTGEPLLVVANEVSGTTSIFRVRKAD